MIQAGEYTQSLAGKLTEKILCDISSLLMTNHALKTKTIKHTHSKLTKELCFFSSLIATVLL